MAIVGQQVQYWETDHEELGTVVQYDSTERRVIVQWDNPLPWMKHGMSEVCVESSCLLNRIELVDCIE